MSPHAAPPTPAPPRPRAVQADVQLCNTCPRKGPLQCLPRALFTWKNCQLKRMNLIYQYRLQRISGHMQRRAEEES